MNALTTLTTVTSSIVTISVPVEFLHRQVEVTIVPVERNVDLRDLPANGTVLARLFQQASELGGIQDIQDAAAWQREQRRDRSLPGRENA